MTIRPWVDIIQREAAEGLRILGIEVARSLTPGAIGIVALHIPQVIRYGEDAHLRGLGVLHRVGDKAAEEWSQILLVALHWPEQQVVNGEVRDGIVQPYIALAAYAAIDVLHRLTVDHRHHGLPRPHDMDLGIHRLPQDVEVATACPGLVVLRGTEDERLDLHPRLGEVAPQVVEKLSLVTCALIIGTDVVEEDREGAHPEAIHILQLAHDGLSVLLRPLDVQPGMDGPDELHAAGVGHLDELSDALTLSLRVQLTPLLSVVAVVLRPIDIGIELGVAVEAELLEAIAMAVGIAVEALDDATQGHVGPVGDGRGLEAGLVQQLA